MTKRYCTEEDVRQTVNMTFFQCVQRYERKGDIPFSAFLYSYFFYLLKKSVDTFLIDQLGRKSFALVEPNNSDSQQESEVPGGVVVDTLEYAFYDFIFAEEVDEYWVLGETATVPFDQLTVQERQLLKWRYIDKKRSSEIALKITEHPNTVREHISKIKDKLRNIVKESNKYDMIIPIDLDKEEED